MPKVSIIVPNYNHAPFLHQRIDSIFNQTFQDFEVIILDDCSTDSSVEILSEYSRNPKVSNLILNKTNSGNTFLQWEMGLKLAKGELIWIAESDDWAENTFLEECINYYEIYKDQNIGIINCNSNVIVENEVKSNTKDWTRAYNEILKFKSLLDGKTICKDYLIEHNIIPNASAVLIKKSAIKTINFNSDFIMCGDWYIWFEILLEHNFLFIDKTLNNFRKHSSNITHSNDLLLKLEGIKLLRLMVKQLIQFNHSTKFFYNSYFRWCFYGSFWGDAYALNLSNFKNYFYKFDVRLIIHFFKISLMRLIKE